MATKPRWQIVKEAQQAAGKTNMSAAEFAKTNPVGGQYGEFVGAVKSAMQPKPQPTPQPAQPKGMGQLLSEQTKDPEASRAAFNAAVAPVVEPMKRKLQMTSEEKLPTPLEPMIPVSARGGNANLMSPTPFLPAPREALPSSLEAPQPQQAIVPSAQTGGFPGMSLPQTGGAAPQPSIMEMSQMSPLEQMQYAAQFEQQQAVQVAEAQIAPLQQQIDKYDQEISQLDQQAQEAFNLTDEQKKEMDDLKASIEREKAFAIEQAQKSAARAKESVTQVLTGRGFGRSTLRADKIAEIESDLAYSISEIETNANRRIKDIEVSMLAANKTYIKELQDRIEKKEDQKDKLQLQMAEKTGELMKVVIESSPNNPVKIMEAIQKAREFDLQQAKFSLDVMKFNSQEKREFMNQMTNTLKWGVDAMGGDFINSMSDEQVNFFSQATGIPLNEFKGIFQTQAEKKMLFDAMKFDQERQDKFALKDIEMAHDENMRLLDFDLDSQATIQKANVDFDRFVAENSWKNENEALAAMRSLKSLGLISDAYSAQANQVVGDNNYYAFSAPVPHPNKDVNIPVVEANSKIANFFPQDFSFVKDLPSNATNLAGHCAWFAQQIVNLPKVGNSLSEKITKLTSEAKAGRAFFPGEDEVQVGHTILTKESRQYGHIMVVNAKTADGKLVITEANRQGVRQVTHDRIVDPNDPMIIGVFKTVPLDDMKETASNVGANTQGRDVYSLFSEMGSKVASLFTGTGGYISTPGAAQVGYVSPPAIAPDLNNPFLNQIAQGNLPKELQEEILKDILTASKSGMLDARSAAEINAAFAAGAEKLKVAEKVGKLTDTEQKTIRTFSTSINVEKEIKKIPLEKQTDLNLQISDWWKSNRSSDGGGAFAALLSEWRNSGKISEEEQLLLAAKGQWMEANLRLESGAAISVGEFLTKDLQWFPQYGETVNTAKYKEDARVNQLYTTAQMFPNWELFLPAENKNFAKQLFQNYNDPTSYYESLVYGGNPTNIDTNRY